jgi:hypothetical protein
MTVINRKPQVGDFCEVNYDGRICNAKVTDVTDATFDVKTSFGQPMYNIPIEKFKYKPSLGSIIVNMLNEEYSLDLKTVDSFSMSERVDELIKMKSWMAQP